MDAATNYCRVCLETNATNSSLYSHVQQKYLPTVIDNICGVVISSFDEPEALICRECAESLVKADHIIQKCQQSHMFLKDQKLKNIVNKNEKDEWQTTFNVQFKQEPEEIISDDFKYSNDFIDSEADSILSNSLRDYSKAEEIGTRKRRTHKKVTATADVAPPLADLHKSPSNKSNLKKSTTRRGEQYLNRRQRSNTVPGSLIPAEEEKSATPYKSESYYRSIPKVYFRCELCQEFESNVASHAITHLKTVHDVERPAIFRCTQCNTEPFIKHQSLQRHIATKHKQKLRKKDPSSVSYRESKHNFYFRCELCHEYESNIATYAITHLTTVHGIKKPAIFRCLHCDATPFIKNQSLQEHIATIHEHKPRKRNFVCQECEKRFLKRNHLEKHLVNVHKLNELSYQCDVPVCENGVKDTYEPRLNKKRTHGLKKNLIQ